MGRAAPWLLALTLAAVGDTVDVAAQPAELGRIEPGTVLIPRVRSEEASLAAFIARAAAGSPLFRRLLDEVNATNGLVYVERGQCPHGGAACLVSGVTLAGPHRVIRTVVNPSYGACDLNLMASIGHELQHAVEILRVPSLDSTIKVFHYFAREGRRPKQFHSLVGGWETTAALQAGVAVLKELQRAATEQGRPCRTERL